MSSLDRQLAYEMDQAPIPKFSFVDQSYSTSPDVRVFRVSLETDADRDDNDKDTVSTFEFGPPPIFPLTALYHTRELPNDRCNPRYADRWPVGFEKEEWPSIWAGQTLPIDRLLQEYRLPYRTSYVTTIAEHNYRGTPWRLRIDEVKASKGSMPILRHGMILSYNHSNTDCVRYIIDHCIFRDTTVAYLKVYCFNIDQDVCEPDSTRPPFLLTIPIQYCDVRDYPDTALNFPNPTIPSTSLYRTEHDLHRSCMSRFSMDEEDRPGVTVRILRFLSKALCC